MVSAGIAFYFLLAVFPLLASLVSIYAFFVSPDEVADHIESLIFVMPAETRNMLMEQVTTITAESQTTLSISAVVSFLLAVWSSSKGAQALITACNITYNESNSRSLIIKLLMRVLFTVGALIFAIVALTLIAVLPILIDLLGMSNTADILVTLVSWPVLAIIFSGALMLLYRYSPDRTLAKWRWVTPGSFLATILWSIASACFSFYVANYSNYNKTYGSLGGVIILLMWFYISAFVVVLAAEFNAETELQTTKDSTIKPEKKMGQRGAYVADHISDDD